MINSNLISQQGFKPIAILALASVFAYIFICDTFATILAVLTLFVAFVYRNPQRYIYANSTSVLSPIDGKVIAIDEDGDKKKIYCKVNLCDNHVVRAPTSTHMKVKSLQHGLNLDPNSCKGALLNEQIVLKFEHLKLKLVSGFFNRSISNIESKDVEQGENIAMFLDGLAIITIKDKCELDLKLGDSIKAGQTILYKK